MDEWDWGGVSLTKGIFKLITLGVTKTRKSLMRTANFLPLIKLK